MLTRATISTIFKQRYLWAVILAVIGLTVAVIIGGSSLISKSKQQDTSSSDTDKTIACSSKTVKAAASVTTKEEEQVRDELEKFNEWLKTAKAQGFIGELGWPAEPSANSRWNQIADIWYEEAIDTPLWTTVWATGSYWGNYNLNVYTDRDRSARGIDSPGQQAEVFEKYARKCGTRHGINVAGMEFGTDNKEFNNTNLGTEGVDYFYEPSRTFSYLADRGITTIRLPFRWERIQPTLGGELASKEISQIRRMLDAAHANGQRVVLDLHNYGRYEVPGKTLVIGDGELTETQLTDVWLKLSKTFKNHPGLLGYGIMNEPYDLPGNNRQEQAKNWERVTQNVLNDIRASGDKNLVVIPGYDWSSLARWQRNHPKGWITDPDNNFRYEAHHYWDEDGKGFYEE